MISDMMSKKRCLFLVFIDSAERGKIADETLAMRKLEKGEPGPKWKGHLRPEHDPNSS